MIIIFYFLFFLICLLFLSDFGMWSLGMVVYGLVFRFDIQ